MASHGGMREGSGRPAGAVNKATSGLKLNLSELAREYTNDALHTLVDVMQSSQSDSARIAAALQARGQCKPTSAVFRSLVLLALGRFGRISITPRRRTKILAMVANTDNA